MDALRHWENICGKKALSSRNYASEITHPWLADSSQDVPTKSRSSAAEDYRANRYPRPCTVRKWVGLLGSFSNFCRSVMM
jgi:hypothetical protein